MSVANVLKAFKGVFCNAESDPTSDLEDLLSDGTWSIPMVLDAAAGTDYTYGGIRIPFAARVVEAYVVPGAALTAADATANTYTLGKADGAGGSSTAVATLTTTLAGGSWVADTFKAMTLSATFANTLVAEGQVLNLKKTHLSTGTVTPASTLVIRYRKI